MRSARKLFELFQGVTVTVFIVSDVMIMRV